MAGDGHPRDLFECPRCDHSFYRSEWWRENPDDENDPLEECPDCRYDGEPRFIRAANCTPTRTESSKVQWTEGNPFRFHKDCGCVLEWTGALIRDYPCNVHAAAFALQAALAGVMADRDAHGDISELAEEYARAALANAGHQPERRASEPEGCLNCESPLDAAGLCPKCNATEPEDMSVCPEADSDSPDAYRD